ncbi:hypothetical protein NQ318_008094 [Aromia moschata]|uniref:Uncharacterized protein n=1 Tax=Aromia moschata TaxID=1265417 RepID=A0AAV8YPA2_9CUCU|nr:hypothetical protein NQ318_008094 [Aromia moschata]
MSLRFSLSFYWSLDAQSSIASPFLISIAIHRDLEQTRGNAHISELACLMHISNTPILLEGSEEEITTVQTYMRLPLSHC